ncbi:unnamed protein product, partial [marine sediment metagenome]
YFKIDGTGNFLINNTGKDLYIIASEVLTAAVANVVAHRYHLTHENDWSTHLTDNVRDQTGAYTPGTPERKSWVFPKGKMLSCEIDNGNNAQVEHYVFWLADSPGEQLLFNPDMPLPAGYEWRKFTGAKTVTAAIFTDVALTAVDFFPDDDALYHIGGAYGEAATGEVARVRHKSGGTQDIRSGFGVGDIAAPSVVQPVYGDFGNFKGETYPIIMHISVAADTAEVYWFLIKKVSGGS